MKSDCKRDLRRHINGSERHEEKMRVFIPTQTFPPQIGGMENVMAALAEKFGKAGYAVTVLPKNQTPKYMQLSDRPSPLAQIFT